MVIIDDLRALTRPQRSAFIASLLGWTLDAFDFFILTFVVKNIADDFKVQVSAVTLAIALTLIMRPVGAFAFGWLADRFGRRPVLMADVLLFAALEFASGFAPNLATLLVLRLLFGFAMGGEWGIGASLTLESIPARSRGVVSGLLQEGYAFGFLLAALLYPAVPVIGWRGMFMVGAIPALLVLYIRKNVPESPAFEAVRARARAARANRPAPGVLPAAHRAQVLAGGVLSVLGALIALPLLLGLGSGAAPLGWRVGPVPLVSSYDPRLLALTLGAAVPLLAGVLLASAGLRRAEAAVRGHLVLQLRTFWLAVAGAVVFGLILFSISKPLGLLHIPVARVTKAAAALLAVWFLVRGGMGLAAASRGRAMPADDPTSFFGSLGQRWGLLLYVVVLMTCFNLFSHGTQDLYPTFLKVQHRFAPVLISTLTVVLNLGAIAGGLIFGALSERIGRRRAIALAAVLALPVIPLWAGSSTPLMLGLGAFLIQVAVQGAWGVVPVHLNELSPDAARGAFPGFAYQLGNLIASGNAVVQAGIAESRGNDYGFALAVTAGVVAVLIAGLSLFGPEAKGVRFGGGSAPT